MNDPAAKHELIQSLDREIGRREFLRGSALGAALLGGATLLPGCGASGSYPTPPVELKTFSAKEFHILQSVMDTFLPVTRSDELSVVEVGAAENFDGLLADASEDLQGNLKMLIFIFEHGTLPLGGKLRRFTRLSPKEQASFIEGLMRSDNGLKKLLYTVFMKISNGMYYDKPETWALVGYPGPLKTRLGAPKPIGNSTLAAGSPSVDAPGPLRIQGA